MLKAEQIQNAQFSVVAKGAYRAEEVDSFLKVVASDFAALNARNDELVKKMGVLAQKIEQYREEEDSINAALISAERLAKSIKADANTQAEATKQQAEQDALDIKAQAKEEASQIIADAKKQSADLVEKTKATVAAYTEKAKNDTNTAINAANDTAERTIADAKSQASVIIGDSEVRYNDYTEKAAKLREEILKYKAECDALCKKQLEMLGEIEVDGTYEIEPVEAVEAVEDSFEAVKEIDIPVTEMDVAEEIEVVEEVPADDDEPEEAAEATETAEAEDDNDDIFDGLFNEETNDGTEEETDEDSDFGFKINFDDIVEEGGDTADDEPTFMGFFD